MEKTSMKKPTNLKDIRRKVLAFHKKMNAIADYVNKSGIPEIQLVKDHQFMQFYIDSDSFKNLHEISKLDGFDSFVVLFGIEDDDKLNKLTACILGVDAKKNILPQHKNSYINERNVLVDAQPGDDHFEPPPYTFDARVNIKFELPANCFTLNSTQKEIEDYLT